MLNLENGSKTMAYSFDTPFGNPKTTEVLQIRKRLSHLISKAEDRERRRIARELHDGTGQMLALLVMNLGRISTSAGREYPHLKDSVSECEQLARQALAEIRTVSYLLYPPTLARFGLIGALERYINGFRRLTNIEVACNLDHVLDGLPPDTETAIYRIAQECLTNIFRHSGSRTAAISLTAHVGKAVLEIKDQGRGIPLGDLLKIKNGESSGVGLRGIRERAKSLGGSFDVFSTAMETRVRVAIPICVQRPIAGRKNARTGALYEYVGADPQ
jgi:signal transduction histidine kinase